MPIEDGVSSRGSSADTTLLYDSSNDTGDVEVAYYNERTPLLNGNEIPIVPTCPIERLRPRLSRSKSVTSVKSEKNETLSLWTLTRAQKVTLVVTSVVDLITYLSISIMAPFFPEEVRKSRMYHSIFILT